MNLSLTLVSLAGAIALLLWGTHMVQTGVQRAFGAGLRTFLGGTLRNRFRAFLAGIGVTAVLQSSTATGLMLAGFAAGGLLDLVPALAVMLGANVGTTLIVQVFSFDVAALSPALILIGVLMFRRDTSTRLHDLGRVLIGLGLMLLALTQLLTLVTGYEDTPSLRLMLGAVATTPILDVVLAAGLTWAAHSSVAVVLLVMSLAARGVVPPHAAFALVLGANLGTAINPLIEGASGDPASKRLPLGNLLTRIAGVAVALLFLDRIGSFMVGLEPDPGRSVADFHTLFNLVLAALFFPFLAPYARLLQRWLPSHRDPADPSQPLYLDTAARETPMIAIGAAAREALRLVDVLAEMLAGARNIIASEDRRLVAETRQRDDVLDSLTTAIKRYLTSIDPEELGPSDQRRLMQVLTFTMNLEQAGDVVDRSLLPHATKRLKRGLAFTHAEQQELIAMMDRLADNLRTAASLFMTEDQRVARLLADEKIAFRAAETSGMQGHMSRLRSGHLADAQASALQLDLLRDIKAINSHIVAAAAYPILERSGELLASRIARN